MRSWIKGRLLALATWLSANILFTVAIAAGVYLLVFVDQISNIWTEGLIGNPAVFAIYWGFIAYVILNYAAALHALKTPTTPGTKPLRSRVVRYPWYVVFFIVLPLRSLMRLWTNSSALRSRVLGVAAGVLGVIAFVASHFLEDSHRPYVLVGLLVRNAGIWLACAGVWFFTAAVKWQKGASNTALTLTGRALAGIAAGYLMGEIVWWMATRQWLEASYRNYTIWGAIHLIGFVAICARLIDVAAEHAAAALAAAAKSGGTTTAGRFVLLRPALLILAGILLLLMERPQPVDDVEFLTDAELGERWKVIAQADETSSPPDFDSDRWYDTFQKRIASLPEHEPVVIVAASGGGSRAALFSALVFEALSRKRFPKASQTWADRIVLISAVSGGSLSAANFVHRGLKPSPEGPPVNSIRADLVRDLNAGVDFDRMDRSYRKILEAWVEALRLRLKDDADLTCEMERLNDRLENLIANTDTPSGLLDRVCEVLEPGPGHSHAPLHWLVDAALVDDACMDFMAPLIKGQTTLAFHRGDALLEFWAHELGWSVSNNQMGYANGAPPSYVHTGGPGGNRPAEVPLPPVFYNLCNVDRGSRLIVGFPPLPRRMKDAGYGMQSLSDLAPAEKRPLMSLSRAVRLSSNFPFGFQIARCYHGAAETEPNGAADFDLPDVASTDMIDGGVIDNTGIDSVYLLFERLIDESRYRGGGDRKQQRAKKAEKILQLLEARGIVLVEIDSGAKPEQHQRRRSLVSGVSGPKRALTNAAYSTSEWKRDIYLDGLDELFRARWERRKAAAPDTSNAPPLVRLAFGKNPILMQRIRFQCNFLDERSAVMTAWTLGPKDKASVLTRFIYAWWLNEPELDAAHARLMAQYARVLTHRVTPARADRPDSPSWNSLRASQRAYDSQSKFQKRHFDKRAIQSR